MKTLYLHIGPYKTGTTALQVFFARNMDTLKAKGIHYLPMGLIGKAREGKITAGNGAFVARALLPDGHEMSLASNRQAIMAEVKKLLTDNPVDKALLSSEFLCDLSYKAFEKLQQFASNQGYKLHIIMFLREQASYLESYYIQRVKRHHLTAGPTNHLKSYYNTIEHLHYGRFAARLSQIVGQENISVGRYPSEDIFGDTCRFLNIDDKGLERPAKSVNISLTPEQLVIMRELNAYEPRQSVADQVVANEVKLTSGARQTKRSVLPPELTAEIRSYYADENKQVSEAFFEGRPLFPETDTEYVNLDELRDHIDLSTVVHMLGGLVVAQEDRITKIENTLRKLMSK